MDFLERHFVSLDSTNSYCKENAENLDDFTFVSASFQEKGRGRNDRKWNARQDENLLFSLFLKDSRLVSQGGFLSLPSAVAVAKCLEDSGLKNVSIKWPNDVYVNGKKIAGILLEGQVPNYLIIGIGINVNQREFEGEYRITPTSVSLEAVKEIDLLSFKKRIYASLSSILQAKEEGRESVFAYFRAHDYLYGKRAKSEALGREGILCGVDSSFRLLLDSEGIVYPIESGEVNLLP